MCDSGTHFAWITTIHLTSSTGFRNRPSIAHVALVSLLSCAWCGLVATNEINKNDTDCSRIHCVSSENDFFLCFDLANESWSRPQRTKNASYELARVDARIHTDETKWFYCINKCSESISWNGNTIAAFMNIIFYSSASRALAHSSCLILCHFHRVLATRYIQSSSGVIWKNRFVQHRPKPKLFNDACDTSPMELNPEHAHASSLSWDMDMDMDTAVRTSPDHNPNRIRPNMAWQLVVRCAC